jgi:hypothetical protein
MQKMAGVGGYFVNQSSLVLRIQSFLPKEAVRKTGGGEAATHDETKGGEIPTGPG